MKRKVKEAEGKRGSILIAVLWSLFFLASLAMVINTLITPQLTLASRLRDRVTLRHITEAGVKKAIIEIRADETEGYDVLNDPWSDNEEAFKEIQLADNSFFSLKYALAGDEDDEGGDTVYGLIDEERKININTATVGVLNEFFDLIGELSSQEVDDVSDSIIDWRDEDDEAGNSGAESSYYESLEPGYACKNAPFDILEELLLVKGMTQDIYDMAKDHLTVYGDGKVNLNTADTLVLQSLGMRKSLAEKVLKFREGDDGRVGTEDDNAFNSTVDAPLLLSSKVGLNAEETNEFIAIAEGDLAGVQSDNFRGTSYGAMQDRELSTQIVFVIDREERIRYWHQK